MRQPLDRIETDSEFVDRADVVIIGGGIAGVSAAYHLASKNLSVVIVEKGIVAAEQSSRNWGWVRQLGRDEAELDLMRRSMSLWAEFRQVTGKDVGFEQSGVLFVTDSPKQLAAWAGWQKMAASHDLKTDMLSAADVARRAPSNAAWIGGIHSPSDGRAEPSKAVPAMASAAREKGVRIYENCAARTLDFAGGRIAGVATERGLIRTSTVLCAGGVWTSLLCRRHGIKLPQASVNGSVLATVPAPEVFTDSLSTPGFSARRRRDGGYTIAMSGRGTVHVTPSLLRNAREFFPLFKERRSGLKIRFGRPFFAELFQRQWDANSRSPFEAVRIMDPEPDRALLDGALTDFRATIPAYKSVEQAVAWGGAIDSLPDAIPVISGVPSVPGLFLSTGYSGHGFGLGPAAGELVADLIAGDPLKVDPHPFRYSRFTDGTRLRPHGGSY